MKFFLLVSCDTGLNNYAAIGFAVSKPISKPCIIFVSLVVGDMKM